MNAIRLKYRIYVLLSVYSCSFAWHNFVEQSLLSTQQCRGGTRKRAIVPRRVEGVLLKQQTIIYWKTEIMSNQ